MNKIVILLMGFITVFLLASCGQLKKYEKNEYAGREVADKLSQNRAVSRKNRVSNTAYNIYIDLVSNPDLYQGKVTLSFNLSSIDKNLTIDFTGGSVASIEVNTANVKVDYSGFFITLPADALRIGTNNVVISYSHPYDQDGTGLHKFVDSEDGRTYLYTYLWPYYSNRLFPNFDQPNLKASYEMTVRAKADWQVVSSELEDDVKTEGADKIWHFPPTKRFSSYIFSLHAGPYKVWNDKIGDVPIRLMARQSLAKYVDVKEWFEFTKMGLSHYKKYFDIAYPFSKYDQLIVPEFNIGAMENVGAVTFTEYLVQRGPSNRFQRQARASTILHEMAHMWFGDLVTHEWWNGLWLNESFATLMSNIAVSNLPEFSDLWHGFYLNTNLSAIRSDKKVSTHPIEMNVPSTNDFFAVFDGITYQKGASVLNQLSHYTGQENFRLGVSNYLKKHAWGNTELKDFIDAQAQQSGLNLTPWAAEWLYKAGVNRIKVKFSCEANKISHFEIQQFADENYPTLRSQRIQLALFNINNGREEPYVVQPVNVSGAVTNIPELQGLACPTLAYPNYQGWGYTEVELDEVSKSHALSVIKNSNDPLLRSMLWTSVLNNSNSDLERVLESITNEKNDRIINQVFSAILTKLNNYERQNNPLIDEIGPKAEALLWKQINSDDSNENTLLIKLDMYIAVVRSERGRRHLIELLENTVKLPSLPISQEHRWNLIIRLALLNDNKARDYISKEKIKDNTDSGKLSAIAAESSLPDSTIKSKWMSNFMDNENPLPYSSQRVAMASMFPANQMDFQEKLLPEMLKALPMIRETRDNYYQSAYARSLFSGICSKGGLSQLEAALDKNKIGTTLYRFLSENIQKAQKCVKEKII